MRGVNGVFYLSRKRKYEKTSDFTLPGKEKWLETLNLASNRPAGSRRHWFLFQIVRQEGADEVFSVPGQVFLPADAGR